MLVLSRKVGERILVGDKIRITVVRVSGGGVRLGIEAPADVPVIREEVLGNEEACHPPPSHSKAPSKQASTSASIPPRSELESPSNSDQSLTD